MRPDWERSWVAARNSSAWRALRAASGGRRLQATRAAQELGTARRFVETALRHRAAPERFASVQVCCLFLGTVKSGGTLLGALLDAHARVVIADEVGVPRYVAAGFSREQLFHLLAKAARREALKGRVTARRLEPYSLAVPGQHQGGGDDVLVVGDSKAGPTTRLLGHHPELIDRLRSVLAPVEDRYIHVVRDPIDPISAMVVRGRRTLDAAIDDYAAQSRRLSDLRGRLGADRILTVHYEDLVRQPEDVLRSACSFLGVHPDPAYLTAAAAIVDSAREGERRWVSWPAPSRGRLDELVAELPFLHRYAVERWEEARP